MPVKQNRADPGANAEDQTLSEAKGPKTWGQSPQDMIDSLPLGLIAVDASGTMTQINPAARQLLGITLEPGQAVRLVGNPNTTTYFSYKPTRDGLLTGNLTKAQVNHT